MNNKSLNTLEFDKIINLLVQKAISKKGKTMAKEIYPSIYINEINQAQDETEEAQNLILRRGHIPLGGIKDIEESVNRTLVSGTLSIEELLNVGDFLYVCSKVFNYARSEQDKSKYKYLDEYLFSIIENKYLEKEISRIIKNTEELNDNASSELLSIRQNISSSNNKIKTVLSNIINSGDYKTMLQDTVITTRNGRFCVPIKQEYRNQFKGLAHDQSGTGQTVFIEPSQIVELNNKITLLKSDEKKEIQKILANLSQLVKDNSFEITNNLKSLTFLDFVFAKGALALEMNGSKPNFNTNGEINIIKGRHPLLPKNSVIPTDIYIGKNFTTLLITGPNTGGKTVSLKTCGLLTIMGQSGLFIPAKEGSILNVFDSIFADIGDEQSIEQSLSTFSSHMTNIVKILKEVTTNSLVIFDELGAGTDPTEGAALAISILESLRKKNIRVLVTTHYSQLKVYAISTKNVQNASCEFDVESLRPTYRLLIGVPGKSNAFSISKRLGLPDDIIEEAKTVITNDEEKLEDVITDLEINRKTTEFEKDEAHRLKIEIESIKNQLEKEKESFSKEKKNIIEKAKDDARRISSDAKKEADRLLKELNKEIKLANTANIEKTRDKLRDNAEKYGDELKILATKNKKAKIDKSLKKGDEVETDMGSGIIVSDIDKNENFTVQIGKLKLKLHISNLKKAKKTKPSALPKASNARKIGSASPIKTELDIRGHTVEEGLYKVDKYLDDAYLAHIGEVSIIHGKGTGVLRNAIRNSLRKNPNVKTYRYGEFGEGDMGVTIVSLK